MVEATLPTTHVLNVDDVPGARYAKTRLLELAGFRVSEAGTGEEALVLARTLAPDLILLDTRLPDIDGFEVCRRLRADPDTATILILQTSAAHVLTGDRVRALNGGADNFLVEPVTQQELIASVRALARVAAVERSLREEDLRKNEFLATLAHELRSPLAPVLDAVELLRLEPHPAGSHQARAVAAVARQAGRLAGLVEDLMDVARLEQGKLGIDAVPVSARELVQRAAQCAAPALAAAGQAFDIDLPHPALRLAADMPRLLKVLAALLQNAAKFSDPGSRVMLRAAAFDGDLLVQVQDHGIGISAADSDRIFDLFTQAGHRAGRVKDGLGIGLSLARAVLALHGGEIAVYSKGAGQGSVFEVRLPLAASVAEAPPGLPVPMPDRRPLRALLVDDNADAVEMLGALLELKGIAVRTAGDGATALAALREEQPDIAILDIGLPDMSGHQLARLMRTATGDALPIVALSGDAVPDAADSQVFDRLLDKPVRIDALLAVMRALTGQYAR
ncbi:response regulator [Pseudoduganella lurida]|nr:response regulator [Pseudoduganella lurida]